MATTVSTLLTYAENKTQAQAGTLNSALGLTFLNEALLDFRTELIKRGVDASQTQEAYIATISPPASNQGSTFAYPTDMYFLKTIEVNMTTGNPQDYVQAQQIDVSNTSQQVSFDWLRANQDANQPLIDDRGDTFEIFPSFAHATNFSNAIKIIYFLTPTPYSTTSDILTYPDTLDYYILAIKVSALYYESLNKFNEADYWNGRYKDRLAKLVTTEAQGMQQPIEPQIIQDAGWTY